VGSGRGARGGAAFTAGAEPEFTLGGATAVSATSETGGDVAWVVALLTRMEATIATDAVIP